MGVNVDANTDADPVAGTVLDCVKRLAVVGVIGAVVVAIAPPSGVAGRDQGRLLSRVVAHTGGAVSSLAFAGGGVVYAGIGPRVVELRPVDGVTLATSEPLFGIVSDLEATEHNVFAALGSGGLVVMTPELDVTAQVSIDVSEVAVQAEGLVAAGSTGITLLHGGPDGWMAADSLAVGVVSSLSRVDGSRILASTTQPPQVLLVNTSGGRLELVSAWSCPDRRVHDLTVEEGVGILLTNASLYRIDGLLNGSLSVTKVTVSAGGSSSVALAGDHLFVASGTSPEVRIFTVTPEVTLVEVLQVSDHPASVDEVAIGDDVLYAGLSDGDTVAAAIETGGLAKVSWVKRGLGGRAVLDVVEGLAAFTGPAGLQIRSAADLSLTGEWTNAALGVMASAPGYVYAISPNKEPARIDPSPLFTFDISNPSQPRALPDVVWVEPAQGIERDPSRLYVGTVFSGLWVFDVSSGGAPIDTGRRVQMDSEVRTIAIDGERGNIYSGLRGAVGELVITDISVGSQPRSRLQLPGLPTDIEAAEDQVAVALDSGSMGLVVVDVTDPDAPSSIGSYATDYPVRSLARVGDGLVAIGGGGFPGPAGGWLDILDVSDGSNPRVVARHWFPSRIEAVSPRSSDSMILLTEAAGAYAVQLSTPTGRLYVPALLAR